jgi:acetyltransferase (GNAT) family protein
MSNGLVESPAAPVLLITQNVAQRLETAEAIDAAGCAEAQRKVDPSCDATAKAIAGGVAVFCGAESPLTHSLGLGMHGPVSAEEMDELETFFHDRGASVTVDLCPYSDQTLRDLLSDRGYRIVEFINVMVRTISRDDAVEAHPGIEVRQACAEQDELYVKTVIGGFFGREDLTEHEVRLGTTLFHMPCTSGYLAWLEGEAVGGGGLSIRNKVASLFGDATRPAFRCRGVHSAIIRSRMIAAQQADCELITAGAIPGSGSQRNYERLGFQVAYSKAIMVLE